MIRLLDRGHYSESRAGFVFFDTDGTGTKRLKATNRGVLRPYKASGPETSSSQNIKGLVGLAVLDASLIKFSEFLQLRSSVGLVLQNQ